MDILSVLSGVEIDLNSDDKDEDEIAAQVFTCDWTCVSLYQGLVEVWDDNEKNQVCCIRVVDQVAEPTENKNTNDLDTVEHSDVLVSNGKDKDDVQ